MTKSISILSAKEIVGRAARYSGEGKWRGGPNFIFCSRFGSKKSNSGGTGKGRSKYSCGTDRAYIGDIFRNLYASYAARKGR
jgi:hypothetical protein